MNANPSHAIADGDIDGCTKADRLACLHDLPTAYGEVAPILVANGWAPVPLDAGTKVPNRRGWPQRITISPSEICQVVEQELSWRGPTDRRWCAGGIVVPANVLAIDSDALDQLVQDAIWQMMVDTFGQPDMVRVGRAPKWMAFYSAAPGIRSRKLPGIELFCGSGQIAAFGNHSTTGQPYAWSERNTLNTRPDELSTRVSPQQVTQFIDQLVAAGLVNTTVITGVGRAPGSHVPHASYEATARLHELFDRYDGLVKPAVRELIREIGSIGHGRHNALIAIAGRLVFQHWDDQQAIDFLVPLVKKHFSDDDDWPKEVTNALGHARKRETTRLASEKTATWPSRPVSRLGAGR